MVEKSVEDVGRDNTETDNIPSLPENHLDTNSGLTTKPDTEKKKRRKKRSKDDINQSSASAAAITTTSMDIGNEINGVPANVDPVDATHASLPMSRGNPLAESGEKGNFQFFAEFNFPRNQISGSLCYQLVMLLLTLG